VPLIVRILPDEPAIDREFTYLIPDRLIDALGGLSVELGTIVRVPLKGRKVRGWVTGIGVDPPSGVELQSVTKISGIGPPGSVLALAEWASMRWAGNRPKFLRTATADRIVSFVPSSMANRPEIAALDSLSVEAFRRKKAVVRMGPNSDDWPLISTAASFGSALILTPTVAQAKTVLLKLKRAGFDAALAQRDWEKSAAGNVTVGARAAAWAPIPKVDSVLVLDEHDESYQEEAAPTWNARDVAIERAKRDGSPWVVASSCPSLEMLTSGAPLLTMTRQAERASWPTIEIADRRAEAPSAGEWCSEPLTRALRQGKRVVCVINRKGRARFAYCGQCGELARSEVTGQIMGLDRELLIDALSGETRPAVCADCGSTRFRRVKLGVKGIAEELAVVARREVVEVTSEDGALPEKSDLYVGTEAVLHRLESTDIVAFLDFDQELLAPRYRAAEQAMALLVKAARLIGRREKNGRIIVQTRIPDHPVLDAAYHSDPGRLARSELETRQMLQQPPIVNWAIVSGTSAAEFMSRIDNVDGVETSSTTEGTWRLRSQDRQKLLNLLKDTERPPGRLRIEIDPLRA